MSDGTRPSTPAPRRVMVCAGETSGDMYAAALVRALRPLLGPQTQFFGIGGDAMRAEGVELFAHVSETGVIGFVEVARRFRFFSRLLRTLKGLLETRRPDLLVTVDYPGMNLRLAAAAKALGVPAVHWVCPQVWAWRRGRIPKIAASLDKLLCFFPFEPTLFEGTGLDVEFTGHPLVEQIADFAEATPPSPLPWGEGRRIVLMCGSRPGEVRRLLPDLLSGAALAEGALGPCSFLLPAPDEARAAQLRAAISAARARRPRRLEVVAGRSRQAMREAEAGIVKSGTSTLEAALLGLPHSLAYRVAPSTYAVMRRLLTGVRWIGLPNIVAGKTVVPERIQNALSPQSVRDDLVALCTDEAVREAQLAAFGDIRAKLGGRGATARAAAAVAAAIRRR